jgi:hypothetical protein
MSVTAVIVDCLSFRCARQGVALLLRMWSGARAPAIPYDVENADAVNARGALVAVRRLDFSGAIFPNFFGAKAGESVADFFLANSF